MEQYIFRDNKKLRLGYTTGSCAAAAAKAAAEMLIGEYELKQVDIMTPKGIGLALDVRDITRGPDWVCCAIQKDSGDDPDVTDKILVYAKVTKRKEPGGVLIDGGVGVGRVTKPGLEQPVGSAAINRVPRQMIEREVTAVRENYEFGYGLDVLISVPQGEQIAKRTYNPRLGIEGGISILGTSGIVEPMSEKALVDSIKLEMNMMRAAGREYLIITPGNYGAAFAKMNMGIDLTDSVKCANFVGETIDYGVEIGLKGILLIGHIGKFVKLAGGVMNTHSRYADCRMEILTAHAAALGANSRVAKKLMQCITTDDAIEVLEKNDLKEKVLRAVIAKMDTHIKARSYGELAIEAITFSNKFGLLGKTQGADGLLKKIEEQGEKKA